MHNINMINDQFMLKYFKNLKSLLFISYTTFNTIEHSNDKLVITFL